MQPNLPFFWNLMQLSSVFHMKNSFIFVVNQAPFGLPMHLAVSAVKSMLHKQQPTASPHEINKMVPLIMSQSLGNDMGVSYLLMMLAW